MAPRLQLLSFPLELLIMKLQYLGYKDLIICSMVCKCFYKLVKEAVQLSYIVELGVDGFIDGPPSDLGAGERLQILLDLRERWRTFDWVKREIVNPYPTKRKFGMIYAQGILSQIMRRSSEGQDDSSIFSTVLPTRSTEAAECGSLGEDHHQDWTHFKFCMDPAADVIIFAVIDIQVLNGMQLGTQSIEVESYLSFVPRSLSSNGTRPHPLCRSERLQLMAGTHSASILDPQIAGDMVGITVIARGKNSIAIYNWQLGELVVRMTHLDLWPVKDFAFLSPRSFVLSSEQWIRRTYIQHALLLFTFCDELSEGIPWTTTAGVVKHIVTLVLPEVAEGQYSSGYVNTTSCASYHPRGIPFKVADPSRILVYDAGQGVNPLSVRMVIHTDVFVKARKLLSTGPTGQGRSIPWDAWGPAYTRVFTHNYNSLAQKSMHGERVVIQVMQIEDSGRITQSICLMDINRRAHRRQMASGVHDPMLVTKSTTVESSLFTKPITTSLPLTLVRVPNVDLRRGFLLDEQRLLGFKMRALDNAVEELEAFIL